MPRIFEKVRPDIVVHTASPRFDTPDHVMYKVNVEGTKTLIQIAKESGTRSFVYTSSASVISDAEVDLKNADETYPIILDEKQPEFYVYTKALAELHVLSQNYRAKDPRENFLTCALRPSGIFGVGDLVVMPGILDAYFQGRTKVQIGNNRNLFDFIENTNVAYAHYLAAAELAKYQKYMTLPAGDAKVDGEAFFITNDEPRCFWDFTRLAWKFAGDTTRQDQVWVISRRWALLLAALLECTYWAFGLGNPPLTRTKVRLCCMTRYFCIDKAKKRLKYKPLTGLEEGLRQAVEDCVRRRLWEGTTATLRTDAVKQKGQ